jgi:hypothetical protein
MRKNLDKVMIYIGYFATIFSLLTGLIYFFEPIKTSLFGKDTSDLQITRIYLKPTKFFFDKLTPNLNYIANFAFEVRNVGEKDFKITGIKLKINPKCLYSKTENRYIKNSLNVDFDKNDQPVIIKSGSTETIICETNINLSKLKSFLSQPSLKKW